MKKYIFKSVLAVTLLLSACNNDYLEYDPLSSQTEVTAFTTYDNFKTYSWGLYGNLFLGGTLGNVAGNQNVYEYPGTYQRDADDAMFKSGAKPSWAWQTVTNTTSGNWNFSFIRQVNIMLDNIDQSQMSDNDKNHWRAVGYFFRAYRYSQLIANFGDVPWLEHAVKTSDNDIIYGPRTPRNQVADQILNNLLWAESHIKPEGEGSGSNSVNVHVVRALISRFGLAEGTWRKYHQLGGHEKFIEACITASKKVIDVYPDIQGAYEELYNSESLAGVTEVLLYRAFEAGQSLHNLTRYERTSSANTEMSKEGVACYLTLNGLPVTNANNQVDVGGQYHGDATMYDEFRNRDTRLLNTVTPPFRLAKVAQAVDNEKVTYLTTKNKLTISTWDGSTNVLSEVPVTKEDSTRYVTYIELMKNVSRGRTDAKFPNVLPTRNWEGNSLLAVPHFNKVQEGRGFLITRGGYYVYKYYNTVTNSTGQTNTTDIPVIRVGEVMLNYAEAMWEQGLFDQGVADITINKLRPRANVAPMVVAGINTDFDPQRDKGGHITSSDPNPITDYEVDPVLWEIRRERRVELMGDGFRFDDLKRWRKGHYLNKLQLGVTIDNKNYGNNMAIWPYDKDEGAKTNASNNQTGPVALFGDPVAEGKGWKWYYYLYPVPPTQIALNPALIQNPGWEQD